MAISIREMTIGDYPRLYSLWEKTPGIGLSDADAGENIAQFLDRNPGMSFTAFDGDTLVGAVLCGNDGRRGYIHHLAVADTHRRKGIGGKLVGECLKKLRENNIHKCHLFVFVDNQGAIDFWEKVGWEQRGDLLLMSKYT
ncbi:MAG: GNAT family N-acetyltransferase [Anaerolineales bacterium]|jgi:ribosomal protein S18 acetylase RimI-like enzyme